MSRRRTIGTRETLLIAGCLAVALVARPALAYRPNSPEVQALVNRGIAFIEKSNQSGPLDQELGAICVCALACYSHTGNPEHPFVLKAVEAIRKEIQAGLVHSGHSNYSIGLAMILLGSVDAASYRQEMQALLNSTYKRQMPGGAWSYPEFKTGDTSQTQFSCLGLWMAHRQGINIEIPAAERVTNWLLRTQALDGAFGYQGNDPGSFTRIAQERTTNSMGVAGTASLYVCGELLGFITPQEEKKQGTPDALKRVSKKNKQLLLAKDVDIARWRQAVRDGDTWVSRNAGVENFFQGTPTHQFYYMYTMERYWAFRELTLAAVDPEPAWYNAGVDYLRKKIEPEGSWTSNSGPTIETAFAVLFLLRSSKKTIQKIIEESGTLTGGKTLPDDLTEVKQDRSGKIVSIKETPLVEDLLSMLESKDTPLSEFLNEMPDQLRLATDPAQRAQQITRLRRMAINGPFQARLTAVKTLSRERDLDNAPALIFAITDPDSRVSRAAANGMRFYSRKLDGPMAAEDATGQQKRAVAEAWKQWYLGIRPDGTLIE